MKNRATQVAVILLGAATLQTMSGCYAGPRAAKFQAPPPNSASAANGINPGLEMVVKNWTIVDSEHATAGKKVSAQVRTDVKVDGRVVIPHKSVLHGHVAEVQKMDKNHPEARLRVVFDSIRLHGRQVAFTGVIEQAWIEDSPAAGDCMMNAVDPCQAQFGPSTNLPSPGDDLSYSRFVKDKTGDGMALVSERNIYLGFLTRFTVKVISPLAQQ